MNATHLHLLLNHFPIIGTLMGSLILLWGILKKQENIKNIACVVLASMAIIALPVYLTGEPAEETVEKLPGVSEAMIGLHEEAAGIAVWLMGITGLASAVALFFAWQKKNGSRILFAGTFMLSVISFVAMARTGYYGGKIRHAEIRDVNMTAPAKGNEQPGRIETDEKDEK
jgi:uncharacterized membrane protein